MDSERTSAESASRGQRRGRSPDQGSLEHLWPASPEGFRQGAGIGPPHADRREDGQDPGNEPDRRELAERQRLLPDDGDEARDHRSDLRWPAVEECASLVPPRFGNDVRERLPAGRCHALKPRAEHEAEHHQRHEAGGEEQGSEGAHVEDGEDDLCPCRISGVHGRDHAVLGHPLGDLDPALARSIGGSCRPSIRRNLLEDVDLDWRSATCNGRDGRPATSLTAPWLAGWGRAAPTGPARAGHACPARAKSLRAWNASCMTSGVSTDWRVCR